MVENFLGTIDELLLLVNHNTVRRTVMRVDVYRLSIGMGMRIGMMGKGRGLG